MNENRATEYLPRCYGVYSDISCGNCPYRRYEKEGRGCIYALHKDALAMLKEQDNCENCAIAIEDRQPVVRCKDCKHQDQERLNDGSGCFICRKGHGWKPDDWFCADGERKEGR